MTNKIHQNMRAGKRQSQDTSFAGQSSLRPYHGEKVFFPRPAEMQCWEFHPLSPLNFHPSFCCPCSCRLRKRFMAHFLRECRTCMQTATWRESIIVFLHGVIGTQRPRLVLPSELLLLADAREPNKKRISCTRDLVVTGSSLGGWVSIRNIPNIHSCLCSYFHLVRG